MTYLAYDPDHDLYLFTEQNPRDEGFDGSVQAGVTLDSDYPEILRWPQGSPPGHWLGVSDSDDTAYRIFPSREDCLSARYTPLSTHFWSGRSVNEWAESLETTGRR
jgi:hypothetical protein